MLKVWIQGICSLDPTLRQLNNVQNLLYCVTQGSKLEHDVVLNNMWC